MRATLPRSITLALLLAATAGLGAHAAQPLPKPEVPIAAEKNPPGDIPDNQAFVTYGSPLGFHLSVPEGWARRDAADGVEFSDKYNRVQVQLRAQATAPTIESVRADLAATLERQGRAVRIARVGAVTLNRTQVIEVRYGSNSDPNPVTNKAIRLDNARYYFWSGHGKLALLTLATPAGADNADQWQLIAKSFGWQ